MRSRLDLHPQPQLEALPALLDAVGDWHPEPRLQLLVDEWFVNAITHGGVAPPEGWLRVEAWEGEEGGLHLLLSDSGPHFAPGARELDAGEPLEARAVGGLGLALMQRLCRRWSHEPVHPRGNRLHLEVPQNKP